jgi:hypothetical protein
MRTLETPIVASRHAARKRHALENRPTLSLRIRAEIEQAKQNVYQSAERFNLLFLPARPITAMAEFAERLNPSSTRTNAPRQSMSAALQLQIEDFTGSLFDIEASHYSCYTSDIQVLLSWLN